MYGVVHAMATRPMGRRASQVKSVKYLGIEISDRWWAQVTAVAGAIIPSKVERNQGDLEFQQGRDGSHHPVGEVGSARNITDYRSWQMLGGHGQLFSVVVIALEQRMSKNTICNSAGRWHLPSCHHVLRAGVAQLAEHNVANVVVVGSNPITRSFKPSVRLK